MPDGFIISDANATEFSDDALALAFSERHTGQLLYVPAWSSWLRWDGCRWAKDDTLRVFDLARAISREQATEAEKRDKPTAALAKGLSSAGTVAAIERLARADERHARSPDAFDADPWSLNTPAGVVDLRTGKMRPHRPGDLFTKATRVAPDGSRPPLRWLRFLLQACRQDKALVRYLQRWIGYSLTGLTREHRLIFIYGPGGNGKGVLLGTVASVMGDYATTAMADLFTVTRNEQHPTHLAALRGARLVAVTETEEGRQWAESRIKAMTGGDRITARVMRGDPFEFTPAFKLWITGNHKPVLRNPDPAMRRRLDMVPFTYVPPKNDLDLADKLKHEWPAILAWAIKGCELWHKSEAGLVPPPIVVEATANYFAEQDNLKSWLAERCENKPAEKEPSRKLFHDWKLWNEEAGEDAGTEKRFSESLQRHHATQRTKSGVVFLGLKLRPRATGAW